MPFLPPNQQRQSTEAQETTAGGKSKVSAESTSNTYFNILLTQKYIISLKTVFNLR